MHNIWRILEERGLTLDWLVIETGYNWWSIYAYKTGRRRITRRFQIACSKALNLPLSFSEGSTDANLPLSLGIPAVTIDAGGRGSGAHTEHESYDATDAWKGTQRALLLTVALAQP